MSALYGGPPCTEADIEVGAVLQCIYNPKPSIYTSNPINYFGRIGTVKIIERTTRGIRFRVWFHGDPESKLIRWSCPTSFTLVPASDTSTPAPPIPHEAKVDWDSYTGERRSDQYQNHVAITLSILKGRG